jgi:hypothetical protein
MEDNLNISKVEHISDHVLDHTLTLNWSLDDKTMFSNPKYEEDFQWTTTSNLTWCYGIFIFPENYVQHFI